MNAPPDLNALTLPDLYANLQRMGLIRRLIELARDEDLGPDPARGDITTIAWAPDQDRTTVRLIARQPGVIAGLAAVPELISIFAPNTRIQLRHNDGQSAGPGQHLADISGPTREVLALERTLLNLVSRLSGVATITRRYVDAIGTGTRAQILDTRKTTPGLRILEKYAVRCGGGLCHRLGLHDAMLVKDNHAARIPVEQLASHAAEAARRARADRPLRFVEMEVDRLDQLSALLTIKPGVIDIILLDNMTPDSLRQAVALRDRVNPRLLLEASGGITLDTIRSIAETGVDRISVGALTHSVISLDLGLDVDF